MGQIYLQVKTNNNDGVPIDQVAYVKGLTAAHFGAADHAKQGDLASIGRPNTLEVTARGSGYTSNPTVTFGTETFQTERGTGDPTSEPILIFENGAPKSSDGLYFKRKVTAGSREFEGDIKLTAPNFNDLYNDLGSELQEVSLFNPYHKNISYGDIGEITQNIFQTWGAVQGLSAISDMRDQISELNEKATVTAATNKKVNIARTAGYQKRVIAEDERVVSQWHTDLQTFQTNESADLLNFTTQTVGTSGTDPAWELAVNTVSRLLPFLQAMGGSGPIPGIDTTFSRNFGAIQAFNTNVTNVQNGVVPIARRRKSHSSPRATFRDSQSRISARKHECC